MTAAKTFLVSGAASGIGKHMASALVREGHRVMLIDIDGAALERSVSEHALDPSRVAVRVHDVRDGEGWERVVAEVAARWGALDVMLNVAGVLRPGHIHELPIDQIDRQLDVNAKGVIYATRAGVRRMLQQGHGHIVNIASLAGIGHVPGLSVYCASKHAVRGFSLAVAHEVARQGVSVSVLCPDAVETPMLEQQIDHPEAALVFGGGRGLTLAEVEKAVRHVLEHKPLEHVVAVPGTGRGALAKLSNAFPPLAAYGLDRVRAQGRKAQAARRSAPKST